MATKNWIVFAVLILAHVTLVIGATSTEVVFLAAIAAVVVLDVIPLEQALQGFAKGTLLALAALFVVAAALRDDESDDDTSTVVDEGSVDHRGVWCGVTWTNYGEQIDFPYGNEGDVTWDWTLTVRESGVSFERAPRQ